MLDWQQHATHFRDTNVLGSCLHLGIGMPFLCSWHQNSIKVPASSAELPSLPAKKRIPARKPHGKHRNGGNMTWGMERFASSTCCARQACVSGHCFLRSNRRAARDKDATSERCDGPSFDVRAALATCAMGSSVHVLAAHVFLGKDQSAAMQRAHV